jgi:hypothetical protein
MLESFGFRSSFGAVFLSIGVSMRFSTTLRARPITSTDVLRKDFVLNLSDREADQPSYDQHLTTENLCEEEGQLGPILGLNNAVSFSTKTADRPVHIRFLTRFDESGLPEDGQSTGVCFAD